MTLILAPNIEALVGTWLREHPEVSVLGARVAGATPATTTAPWVRVTLLGARDSRDSSIEWFVDYILQLDCYAGKAAQDSHNGQAEAWQLKATVRAALKDMQGRSFTDAVVTDVTFSGDARLPDTAMEPARERYVLTVTVSAHGLQA